MRANGCWSAIQAVLWLAWGGLALVLCWLGPWFTPSEVEETRIFWRLVMIWVVLTGGVLVYILFGARTQLHLPEAQVIPDSLRLEYMNRRIITLGLIGGFSIAMPALAFTIIGFVAMVPHFNRGFSEQSTLALPDRQQLEISVDGKSSYIVAVDVSESNLPGLATPKRPQVAQVCDAVRVLLAKGDGVRIVRPEDSFRALVFAGERDDVISQDSNYDKDFIRSTFCNTLEARLKSNIDGRERTNFESFLDFLGGWASGEAETHESVTLFIFSDFMHETSPDNTEDIEKTVATFMANMRALGGRVRVVGFSMRGDGWKRPANADDILPYMERYGMGRESEVRIWHEIPMAHFTNAEARDQRGVFIFSSYREVPHPKPLYLRYRITPSWKALPSSLTIPEDADHNLLYFGVRPSHGDAEADAKLGVKFEDGKGTSPFTVSFGRNGIPRLKDYQRRGSSLQAELDAEVEVNPSSECDLKIAVPSLRVVHSINLVMFPTIGDLAEPALRLTLKFLSVAVALLALRASGIPEALGRWRTRNGKGPGYGT